MENGLAMGIGREVRKEQNKFRDPPEVCPLFYNFLQYCFYYYIPFIIVVGVIGNLLSCAVFLTTSLKKRSSSYYLAALSITDLIFLLTLLIVWLNLVVGWEVYHKNGWCETVVYVSAVCSSLSVWLIVAFTFERFLAIRKPLHVRRTFTVSRTKLMIVFLLTVSLTSHTYSFYTAGLVKDAHGIEICSLKMEYLKTMRVITIMDSIFSLIGPLVSIVVMNTMIAKNLLKFHRDIEQELILKYYYGRNNLGRLAIPSSSNNEATSCRDLNINTFRPMNEGPKSVSQQCFKMTKIHSSSPEPAYAPPSRPSGPRLSLDADNNLMRVMGPLRDEMSQLTRSVLLCGNQRNITKMLLLISSVFIILNLPSYIVRMGVFGYALTQTDAPHILWCVQQIFMILYYTHFCINFILYAMCGVSFRQNLQKMLRTWWNFVRRRSSRRYPWRDYEGS